MAGQHEDGAAFSEQSALLEMPISSDSSFVAAPWYEYNNGLDDSWRAEATFGVKHAIFRTNTSVMAIQAGALWQSAPSSDNCSEGGAELRWLAGRSFSHGSFINLEAATRALEGGCESERLDLTVGFQPRENWLAMGQIFLDAPRDNEETVKAQVSLVRFGDRGRGIQLGLRARIDGGPQETAIVLSLWRSHQDD